MATDTVPRTYTQAKRRRASIIIPCTEEGWETRLYLERVCPDCSGCGCPTCYGDGVVPTEAGREFLAFVARWAGR